MRKLLKSKKALSPVVAAIILIAVTVAVSIAVAAWMGSLTMNFMETKELTVTEMTFDATNNNMTVYVTNSGTSEVTIALVKVNGNTITSGNLHGDATYDFTFDPGVSGTIVIDTPITAGNKYAVSIFTAEGTMVGSYTDTA